MGLLQTKSPNIKYNNLNIKNANNQIYFILNENFLISIEFYSILKSLDIQLKSNYPKDPSTIFKYSG